MRYAEARRTKGPADDDSGAHDQGQRRVVRRRARTGWHGRPFKKGEELDRALAELEKQFVPVPAGVNLAQQIPKPPARVPPGGRAEAGCAAGLHARRPGRDARGVRHGDRQARRGRPARRRARRGREELDVQRQVREGAARPLLSELHRRAGDDRRGDGARRRAARFRFRRRSRASSRAQRLHPHGRRSATSASRWPARTPACRSAKTGRRRWRSRIWRCAARSRTSRCSIRATRSAPSGSSRSRPAIPGPAYIRTSRPKTPVIYVERRDVHGRRPQGAARERERRGDGHRRGRHGVRGAEGVRSAESRGHGDPRHRSLLGGAGRSRRPRRGGPRDRRTPDHGRGSLRGRRHRRRGGRSGRRRGTDACTGSPCARFPAAASPKSCSIASASPRSTSSTPCAVAAAKPVTAGR